MKSTYNQSMKIKIRERERERGDRNEIKFFHKRRGITGIANK